MIEVYSKLKVGENSLAKQTAYFPLVNNPPSCPMSPLLLESGRILVVIPVVRTVPVTSLTHVLHCCMSG